ncbi:MAG: hypothetical protein SynsKO_19110 [Synoicihabitans sp.]
MTRGLILAATAAVVAISASAVQVAVTLRNAAPDNGIWAVNPWLAVHDGTYDPFDSGSAASAAVEAASEDGNGSLLAAAFASAQPNGVDAVIPGPIAPGRTYTQIFELDPANPDHRFLSYFAMVIPSNDAFWANDNASAYPIFDGAGNFIPRSFRVYGSQIWDAGTEVNDEEGANTAFLAQAAPNTGTTENGVVALHPGFKAAGQGGILDQMLTRFGGPLTFTGADFTQPMYPVAEITVSLVSNSTSRLLNLSSRGVAGTGDSTQIVGFVVSAGGDKQVLVRAVGPSLSNFGVTNALADPAVKIFNSAGEELGMNDNWVAAEVGDAMSSAGAFALDAESADAAILMTLPAGSYTAQVVNDSGTEGVVLVEIYEVSN